MPEDNYCPVCGKHFAEEEDLETHGKDDHPEFTEIYGKEQENGQKEVEDFVEDAVKDIYQNEMPEKPAEEQERPWTFGKTEQGDTVIVSTRDEPEDAEEIDQYEEKPTQSHNDWQKELDSLRDEFAGEQEKCAICNGEHPTAEHPILAKEEDEEDKLVIDNDEDLYALHKGLMDKPVVEEDTSDYKVDVPEYLKTGEPVQEIPTDKRAEEDGGADAPLKKVADLAENYRYISKDRKAKIFESIGLKQGDANILAGLQWNELTRPIRVEASEAYVKEQQEPEPKEYEGGQDDEEDEDKVYENFYNLERNHSSPDYKKKAITCTRCNEAFYNKIDRDVHFNEVHATEQEYVLPEECPFCNIELPENQDLDYHMTTAHGAHVPSVYTQAGIDAGMADTDYDALENGANWIEPEEKAKAEYKKWKEAGDKPISDYGFDLEIVEAKENYTVQVKDDSGHPTWQQSYNTKEEAEDARRKLEADMGYPVTIQDSGYLGEGRADDLRKEIDELKQFINIASVENPMNMGEYQDKLNNLENELNLVQANEEEIEIEEGGPGSGRHPDYGLTPEHGGMREIDKQDYDPFPPIPADVGAFTESDDTLYGTGDKAETIKDILDDKEEGVTDDKED